MVARRVPQQKPKRKVGRPLGSESEAKRVAKARAAKEGMLPDEMLLDWARTGRMYYPGTRKTRQLEPAERITCARACANFYKAPYQARSALGEQPPIVRLELDEKALAALVRNSPSEADMLRNVLRVFQAGGVDLASMAQSAGAPRADPSRYAKMLTEGSDTMGRA